MNLFQDARTALKSARMNLEIGDVRGGGNRAYYAVFYAVRALLTSLTEVDAFSLKTHEGLRRMFDLNFVKSGLLSQQTAALFNDVQQTRWSADYTSDLPTESEILKAIEKAEAFVGACEELLRERS